MQQTLRINDLAMFPADRYEHTLTDGTKRVMTQDYNVTEILNPDAGPCMVCDKPMARVMVTQHIMYDGVSAYHMTHDFFHAHVDGSPPHTGEMVGNYSQSHGMIKTHCPSCQAWGTLTTTQEAYGDRTVCSACSYNHFYDIGD